MDRIAENNEKTISCSGKKTSDPFTEDARDNPQICPALSNAAVYATYAGGHKRPGVIEIVEEGRRRIAKGEKVIGVIRWAVSEFPQKAIAIATLLAPSHAYGPGKSFDTAEQFGRHAISTNLNKVHRSRRRVPMRILEQMANAGDEDARNALKRRREANRRAGNRSRASGRRKTIEKRYREKLARKKAEQGQKERLPESHDGAQR